MAAFYQELFGNSGNVLTGKAPDVGFVGYTYVVSTGAPVVQNAGFGTMVGTFGASSIGNVDEPPPSVPATTVTKYTVNFKWRSPSSLATGSGAVAYIDVRSKRPSDSSRSDVTQAVIEINTSVVSLHPSTRTSTSLLTTVPGIAPSTVYDVVMTVDDGGCTMSMNGVTVSATAPGGMICGPICGVSIVLAQGNAIGALSLSAPDPLPVWTDYLNTYEVF